MIQGTTAQFKFDIPYNFSDLINVKITFWQPENVGPTLSRPLPIVKTLSHCTSNPKNPKELLVTLTQEETLRFSELRKAYVQLKATSEDGYVFGCKPQIITVYPAYDDDVLGDVVVPPPEDDGLVILDGMPIG